MTVPPREPKALAEAALTLLRDNKRATELVDVAEKEVRELFGPKRHAEQYLQLYNEVIER